LTKTVSSSTLIVQTRPLTEKWQLVTRKT